MNLIVSDLVSKKRNWSEVPVTGLAFVVGAAAVHQVRFENAPLTELRGLVIDGVTVDHAEVWFEDSRERSH